MTVEAHDPAYCDKYRHDGRVFCNQPHAGYAAPDDATGLTLVEYVDGYIRVFQRNDGATAEYGPAGDRLTEWRALA